MKYNSITATLLLTFLSALCCAKTTIEVAETKNYPRFYNQLLGKVQDFLKSKEIEMALDVQALRSKDLWYEGDYFEDQNFYALENMDDRFYREFERFDRKLDIVADRLEAENAPDKVKAQFIEALKADAKASINSLIEHYKG